MGRIMKKGNSKNKGSQFERIICKKLSLWISEGQREDIFWRSAMSGGRATVQYKKGISNKSQVCDISAIDPLGEKLLKNYVIECKFYKNLHLENLVYNTSKKGIISFWKETKQKAIESNKYPILIARQNNKRDIICFPINKGKFFNSRLCISNISFFESLDLAIMYLDDFLKPLILGTIFSNIGD